jgi:16S rRNA (guanine527-N7)-methyltransferase
VSALTEPFGADDFARETGAWPERVADVERYRTLLEAWNGRMNLVGPSAMAAFWLRHAYDSAQLLPLAPEAKVWADLGAGAGFPGIVLAILLKGREGAQVHLVESLTKRCRFLQAVVDELSLPAVIHNARAESTGLSSIDVVTARACAPMDKLLGYAHPTLRGKVRGLFLKGKDAEAEVAEATRRWRFDVAMIPSKSDPSGRIVSITRLARV